ncbi:MAG: ATP-binding protein [Verrucomicrobia bacterium]|nr:ATP-binding protein [Verrucomicrobiota bacterium]
MNPSRLAPPLALPFVRGRVRVGEENPVLEAETTALRSLIHHQGAVEQTTVLEEVQRTFGERRVDYLALVRDGLAVGLCSRLRLGILLGSRFGFALHGRSPAHLAQVQHPLVFQDTTPVREVLDRSLGRRGDEFHEDVVLVDTDNALLGLIPVDALARLQSRLVADQVDELQRNHLELFQANHALRQSQGLYLGLFGSHTLGIALLDREGGIHEHNRRLTELLDLPEEIAGRSLTTMVAAPERAAFVAMLESQARGGPGPATGEFTFLVPRRGPRLIRLSPGWIRETGQICACLEDITEQRALERHMVRQEKQTLLDTLVGGIAHELNNKLTPVQGFSELIGANAEGPTRLYADLIARSVAEAATIIRQLLQLSKPAHSTVDLVDLRAVVEEALTMLRFQIREARCTLRATIAPAPVWVRADPSQIKQVVLNLALNALDAMAGRSPALLAVEVAAAGPLATLVVSDSGVGIAPEIMGRIFDPFFTTKGPERGTGLGLSICFSIVRQHGGDITVDSTPGEGARFCVALPVETAVPLALALDDVPAAPRTTPAHGARVLLVDDEIIVRHLMQEILTVQFGCQVDVAGHGLEALERLAEREYALVVSDIRMPGMNGTELFLWLREAQPVTARRLVLVTGHSGEQRLDDEIAAWGVPLLMKPFTVERFARLCAPYLTGFPRA